MSLVRSLRVKKIGAIGSDRLGNAVFRPSATDLQRPCRADSGLCAGPGRVYVILHGSMLSPHVSIPVGRGRVSIGCARTNLLSAGDEDAHAEDAQRLVIRTSRARVEHPAVSLAV